MANREMHRLVELLGQEGQDNPKVQALLAAVNLDPKMADVALGLLRSMLHKAGVDLSSDPAALPIVTQLPEGAVTLGTVINSRLDGPIFQIPEGSVSDLSHIGVFGQTRYGKSYILMHIARQTILRGDPVWVFDMEDEFSALISEVPVPNRPIAITPAHLRINFFQPPGDWVSPKSWLEIICLLLRGGTFLRDGSVNLLADSLLRLLKSKGVFSGVSQYPSLAETLRYFKGLRLGGSEVRGKAWLESLVNRMGMLCNSFEETSHVTYSNMLQSLADRSVIFRLQGKRGVPLQFLTNFLMVWLSSYKEGN